MDKIMRKLGDFYERLSNALPQYEGNPCKHCLNCCSVKHVVIHRIGLMEIEYLRQHTDKDKLSLFKEYITRKKNEKGELLHGTCPYYDRDIGGCSVYAFRPVSCRLFGHYYIEGSSVPEDCIFKNKGKWIKASRYFEEIPYAKEFRVFNREFLSSRPYTLESMQEEMEFAEGFGMEPIVEDMEFVDTIDNALHLELKGKLDEAYQLFAADKEADSDSPYYHFYFGNLCDEMEKYDEAIEHFRRAVALKEDDSLFHFRLALDLIISGKAEEALLEFEKVTRLNPQNAMALGFLGYIYLLKNDPKEACMHLEKAVRLDPNQQFFRFRLGLAYLGTGRGDDAEGELEKVKDFPPVAKDARHLLAEIARVKSGRKPKESLE